MRKKILLTMALAMLLAWWPLGTALAVESFVQPSGVIQYNAAKSAGGYTLFSGTGAGNTITYLIDMEGYVVNEWDRDYVVALTDFMLPNGNLLVPQAAMDAAPAGRSESERENQKANMAERVSRLARLAAPR